MASNIQPTGLDWKNLPDKTTPISAENLNKMANTIDDLVTAVNPLNTVEANPEGTPTEGLEKVEIDGTLYEVKGGHKILNDSGTTLTQKDNLQFKGVYTQNNGDNTEVDICRTMTKAQMEALSGESLKGFINTSDEPDSLPLTAEWVAYDSNTSVKDKIDNSFKTFAELGSYDYTTSGFNQRSISNISNYRFLLMGIKGGVNLLNPILIPVEYFKTKNSGSNYVGIRTNLNANTFVEIAVYYISNTSIGLYLSGSNVSFIVYGII